MSNEIEGSFDSSSADNTDLDTVLPSPSFLAFISFVLFLMATTFFSRPIRVKCCYCWRAGVPPVWLVCIGLAIVQLGFGAYPIVIKKFADSKEAANKANPLVLSFYRDLCCFPVLFLCAFIAERKIMIPSPKMLIFFLLFGLIGMFGNQYLYILGVYKAGPSVAAAFQPIIPVWTALLVWLTCTEKLTPRSLVTVSFWVKVFGVFLAAGGAIEITVTGERAQSSSKEDRLQHIFGYLCLFGNTLCMAVYVLLQKKFIFDKQDNKWREYPVSVTAYSYFFGAMFMGLCSLQYIGTPENRLEYSIPRNSIYVLIYATFITSALCYLLITWANSQVSSILVTSFWPLQVLIAVLGSWLFLGITFANLQYIGAVMLVIGLACVLFANYEEGRTKEGRPTLVFQMLKKMGVSVGRGSPCEDSLLGSINDIEEKGQLLGSDKSGKGKKEVN